MITPLNFRLSKIWLRLAISLQSLAFRDAWSLRTKPLARERLGLVSLTPFRLMHQNVLFLPTTGYLYSTTPPNHDHDNKDSSGYDISWKGSTAPFSEYAMHAIVSQADAPVKLSDAILRSMGVRVSSCKDFPATATSQIAQSVATHSVGTPMTPHQLLFLGSVWYLPAEQHRLNHDNECQVKVKQHSLFKPRRLGLENATMTLQDGDYLRIHHNPRRFPQVYQADWSITGLDEMEGRMSSNNKVVVVHQQGPGYFIINKPPLIPVHPTVDNAIENVVHQLQQQQQDRDDSYLALVQRIDTNTSGLLVLATTPEFAAYFSKLLRHKTNHRRKMMVPENSTTTSANSMFADEGTLKKGYKCLVCLAENENESVLQAWKRLKDLQTSSDKPTLIEHYLQPSERAPKTFVRERPTTGDDDRWLECWMEITNVSSPIPLYHSENQDKQSESSLAQDLWPRSNKTQKSRIPANVRAVAEVKVSLITGRTHQIRGQLSELGFPIVGDEQYGGADPSLAVADGATYQGASSIEHPQLLALQCCELSFPDADYHAIWSKKQHKDVIQGVPSQDKPKIHASLDRAWWTCLLEKYNSSSAIFGTIDSDVNGDEANIAYSSPQKESEPGGTRSDLLLPSVQLSPGRNKYVMAKLRDPITRKSRWFVKSAAPSECGGPYHANVAEGLVEWIHSVPGYESIEVEITGGGRIDYVPDVASSTFDGATSSRDNGIVHIYGFSYRYGKGDHERAAQLIEESMGKDAIAVTYDVSDDLY
jgi:23S rRNA-/tRNA-specific pseudouridylate synthase